MRRGKEVTRRETRVERREEEMKVIPLIHSLKSEECFEIVVQEALVGSDHAFSACVGSNAAGSGEGLGELGKDWRA